MRSSLLAPILCLVAFHSGRSETMLSGQAALEADFTQDAPGVRHKITVADLPPPYQTKSVTNGPSVIRPPAGAQLRVPAGFQVEQYATGFRNPRYLLTAPNGDIFVTESQANQITILRDGGDGKPSRKDVFATRGLNRPFGLAFYPPGDNPQYLYAANTDGVVRFAYRVGDMNAQRPTGEIGRRPFARRVAPRRRALDPRHHLLAGRQEDVRLHRLALERLG